MQTSANERPLNELLAELSDNAALLLRQETELAKRDIEERLKGVKADVIAGVTGGAVAYLGVLALVAGLILGLAEFIPAWIAALLVGVVFTAVGFFMLQKGAKEVADAEFLPKKSIQSLRQDAQMLKESVK